MPHDRWGYPSGETHLAGQDRRPCLEIFSCNLGVIAVAPDTPCRALCCNVAWSQARLCRVLSKWPKSMCSTSTRRPGCLLSVVLLGPPKASQNRLHTGSAEQVTALQAEHHSMICIEAMLATNCMPGLALMSFGPGLPGHLLQFQPSDSCARLSEQVTGLPV